MELFCIIDSFALLIVDALVLQASRTLVVQKKRKIALILAMVSPQIVNYDIIVGTQTIWRNDSRKFVIICLSSFALRVTTNEETNEEIKTTVINILHCSGGVRKSTVGLKPFEVG